MKDIAELDQARRDGTIKRRLRELVRAQRENDYARRQLALLSPHLTKEEIAYCNEIGDRLDISGEAVRR